MKSIIKLPTLTVAVALIALGFSSCQKNADVGTALSIKASQNGAVAVTASANILTTSSTPTTDSVYAMDACRKDHRRTAVAATALLPNITAYLNTNYSGYTFIKAFSTTANNSTIIDSYVVAFMFNGMPVAIRFDASGNFGKVLELREGKDLDKDKDQHEGGFFDDRDGKQRDSIALTDLSQIIKQYFTINYAKDTLKSAWKGKDGAILVLSKNVTYFGTAFKADGSFIKREVLPTCKGKGKEITQDKLPASVSVYLTATYPNYVFKKAFEHSEDGTIKGYVVIIDANLTKYAVIFKADGTFVEVKTIR